MYTHIPNYQGFIKIILIIVIALIVLGYFGLNITDILASPVVKENLAWFWNFLTHIWSTYLSGPATWLWNHLIKLLWDMFVQGIGNLKANGGQIPVTPITVGN
ncbi:MAG: hypothetical protein NUW02_01995 [Candidatus Campbellbacteria bacterium]|nr:hypothetical protein [Candidatus Campbellbacteria bacterium]